MPPLPGERGLRSRAALKLRAAIDAIVLGAALVVMHPGSAAADPQMSGGVTVGAVASDLRTPPARGGVHLGARFDVLFLRHRESDGAFGPYVDVVTERLSTFEVGGGLEGLIPLIPSFPLVASAGVAERAADSTWQPALVAGLFFGPRSYNFHSVYGLANGVFVQGRYGLGSQKQGDVIAGLQIDFAMIALPFIFAYEALAH